MATPPDPSALPLEQDPTYLAYLRSAGLINQAALATYNRKTSALQSSLQSILPGMGRDDATQQRNLAGSYEDRGMLRSGEALRGASELADQQQRQRAAAIGGVAGDIGNEADTLAQTIAQNQQKAAESGIDAANRLLQYQAGYGGG